jgi:hypothetical protein
MLKSKNFKIDESMDEALISYVTANHLTDGHFIRTAIYEYFQKIAPEIELSRPEMFDKRAPKNKKKNVAEKH